MNCMKFISLFAGLLILPFLSMAENVSFETTYSGNPALYDAYKGIEKFGVEDAWNMDYTGNGVNVAVIDTGIDFATPDLIGTQARISNASSPYFGWPIVIDLDSLSLYNPQSPGNLFAQGRYANTTSTYTTGFQTTGTSKSGIYHIGDHPDEHLAQFYNQPVKILVADENVSGVYDTVYVDLNNNSDFRDDKPCRKGDEISYWDRDNDGYPDESGGMIYFIADGKTPLPFSKMLYGETAKIPKNGELVAFQFDDDAHGTMCAGIIAGQGKNVKGISPDARIVPVKGGSSESDMLSCLLASLGYDGVPNTGDDANVISASRIIPYLFSKGADEASAFLEYLTTEVSPSTTLVFANGNDGSGYSTCVSPCSEHIINIGATYDLWWKNSSYHGDVASFSARGPNALGQLKPNILATGYLAPRVLPLWRTHSGRAAWNNLTGGTSGATPHGAAVMALIYQAYKDAHGEFPTSEKARNILMSSATDINEEIFAQGSGLINAKRAAEIASGKDGVLIEPALISTKPVEAGSNLEFNFTISNYSGKPITLKPQILIENKTKELILKSENENDFFSIPRDMLDCDLVKVSSYYSRDNRSTKPDRYEGYDLCLYNWNDMNSDGKAQENELEAIAAPPEDMGYGFTSESRMHNPAERTDDGIMVGLKRRGEINSDEVYVVIETYKWKPWNIGMNIDSSNVRVSIPTPNTTGVYQGKVLLEYDDERQCIPVSFSTYRNDEVKINNTNDIYENAKIYGRFESEPKQFWDSRLYPIYHYGYDLATIEVTWEDPNTDINVYLYGEDTFNASKIWIFPTKPPVELPDLKILKENGHSMEIEGLSPLLLEDKGIGGIYNKFYTSTGESRETVTGKLTEGLNIIALHKVISGGNKYGENVTIKVNITPFSLIDLRAKAGENKTLQPKGIDGIIGFSRGEEVKGETFTPKAFQADEGDVILIRSNDTDYSPMMFFDSNENGTWDWYFGPNDIGMMDRNDDELIFAKQRYDINPSYTDIIPIHKKGTYFIYSVNYYGCLEVYHMKSRYTCNSSTPIELKVPEQAGIYLGIAEKNGNFIPVPVKLVVDAGDSTSIHIDAANHSACDQIFEVKLEVQDKFGNIVENTTTAAVEFNDDVKKIELINGVGSINFTAPCKMGVYKINVRSSYGTVEKGIEIANEDFAKMSNISINDSRINEMPNVMETAPLELKDDLPEKVQSVSARSAGGNISITWQLSGGSNHYNIYRMPLLGTPEFDIKKIAETNDTEYTMKGKLWNSYTFRVSAVNSEGNESELSDPVGIVVTP